ncbi:MAG: metal ABC transporter substrate-binding protein [Microcystis wesenbergii Mw_QC_S_20081001_S30D]|jgi:manganese/iron transport system substrate-binding protein|uniref:Metal ABC transporter substrate-binding protein n=1 Tax=Microcystis wesenbergii Mw_QC_S_20081001_S30D TaxID=2486245 RepID=A0A552JHA1_9CHRO|nr:zinc ABC transporter solute-binding protein [Microcystis aeruginosa W11-03]NCR94206.1 zinc ABC transporter solute-binding protein [Microcystis aeruginosa W11-06]TRU95117.1 MAG: metal ABC transporter substrate-binding protein [Microcystis wesenbergii Mw_QC_S_20081001_S30D]TRU96907.1 MAG: metal ABC transporter substrate-binding protein [Microcystis wesenbergii Mw_QC_B_20070930_S4D]TRV06510.1 MAG: metal ABC transporter substrate-binding protein [Microcystis wesenbergii Mw_QC_S_20081001_S30]TRV
MKKLILFCLFLGLVACNPSVNTTDNQKPKVISTSTIIADLTARVGGEEIDHQDILKPGDDPHVYEPVPADSVALEKADLILYNGYNLEPGLIKMINSTGIKAKKVAVGEAIKPLQLEKEGQKVPDPHVWGSAKNGIIMVGKIRDQLIELSPEDKEIFIQNAAQLIRELENLDRWITAAIETIPPSQRQLVTTHDAFQYYAHAYGLKVAGTLIGISTEEQPSAQTVKNLADAIKNLQVPAIFAETTINPTLITTVAEEAGVKLAPQQLYSDSIGAVGTGGDSYGKMLKENTRSIVESLGGKVPQEGQ